MKATEAKLLSSGTNAKRNFYKPKPLRTLEEISADILAIEKEAEGLLGQIIGGGANE